MFHTTLGPKALSCNFVSTHAGIQQQLILLFVVHYEEIDKAVAINVPKFLEFRNVSEIYLHSIYSLKICLQPCLVRQPCGRQPDHDHAH